MFTFLFDILPQTGHIRITIDLAFLLNEKGHEVYYTDSSDSVFTSLLLEKGIGRVLYPDDLHWFTPDLVVLDEGLRTKVPFYQKRNILVLCLSMQLGREKISSDEKIMCLPPSERNIPLSSSRMQYLLERIPALKEDPSQIFIVGLLEEEYKSPNTDKLYEMIKKCCISNSHYQLILLVHHRETVQRLFPVPGNMTIYRLLDLPALLPLCDIALTTGNLNVLTENIYAGLPSLIYPAARQPEQQANTRAYVNAGLGISGDIRLTTPEKLEEQIREILDKKDQFKERSWQIQQQFEYEHKNLTQVMDHLTKLITTK